jgi:tRNA A-37 threonylcarbamoyl transferase component Bud32
MQGYSIEDDKGNLVRILDVIQGTTVHNYIAGLHMPHDVYFQQELPRILDLFIECVEAIAFLHQNGEKHGDIRRDHIIIDAYSGRYRWIDFDFNYRHRENIYGYDLFGLGNILVFIVGKGDVMVQEVLEGPQEKKPTLSIDDVNIVFKNRVVNLKKIYPYISTELNRILMHFASTTNRFYLDTREFIEDLKAARKELGSN